MAAADIEYRVLVTYASGGSLTGDLEKAHARAGHLGDSLREAARAAGDVGHELVAGFQHAVEHAAHLAGHLAKIGLAAGVGAAVYGVGHLNNELEQTQISLASIFKAQGLFGTFGKAFEGAADQIGKMKQDIKTLPGDLGQLSNVMLQLASPLATAGKGPDEIRQMAGKTMLASQILLGAKYGSAAQEIGAREMTMLLQGNMSARNSFAMELPGMQQYRGRWKSMGEEQRLAIVQSKIDALVKEAGGKFSTSFVAMWTTFKDNMKYAFLAPATMPLFDAVKKTLADVNKWFDDNKMRVGRWAQQIGDALAAAWERGVELAKEWGPTIVDFARQVHHELSIVWDRFAPALKEAGDALRGALANGTVIKDIEKILELYAVSKVAGGGSGIGKGMGAAMGGAVGGFAGSAIGGEVGSVAGVGGMLFGAPGALAEKGFEVGLVGAMKDKPKETAKAMTELARATQELTDQFNADFLPSLEDFALRNVRLASEALHGLSIAIDYVTHPVESLATVAESAARSLGPFGDQVADVLATLHPRLNPDDPLQSPDRSQHLQLTHMALAMGHTILAQNEEAAKVARGGGRGGGGTHIQKVEIVVAGTQDVNRVAEAVYDKLDNIKRHPKVSAHVPNYSR